MPYSFTVSLNASGSSGNISARPQLTSAVITRLLSSLFILRNSLSTHGNEMDYWERVGLHMFWSLPSKITTVIKVITDFL